MDQTVTAVVDNARSMSAKEKIVKDKAAKECRFWVVFVCLDFTAFLSALEGSIVSTALPFISRSGICGGSTSTNMLIGGRTIQGLGAVGINMLIELILCDLLTLRERRQFFSVLFLFIILGNTHLAVVAVLQVNFAFGIGVVTPSLLTAIQAALPDDLNAAIAGTFAFVRSIGTIWEVSIPAAIFNNRFDQLLRELPDEAAQL
ncbi:hypothetical protein F5B21DRAFT_527654 [Xylaria acuta]|nr:hypothetical protein F5B21DRAFT_527654 [Xylaria acuta]